MLLEITMLGMGATSLMDLWALARKRWFGVAALDYVWGGRWHGQFRHVVIRLAPPVRGERLLGWVLHT